MKVKLKKHHLVLRGDCSKIETGGEGEGFTIISNPKESPLVQLNVSGACIQKEYLGYNLLDMSGDVVVQRVAYQLTQTGIKLTNTSETTYNFVKVGRADIKENQTYTVFADALLSSDFGADRHAQIIAVELDANGNKLKDRYLPRIYQSGQNYKTFTAGAGTESILLQILSSNDVKAVLGSSVEFSNIIVVNGEEVLPYEPYVGGEKSPSIAFPQTVQSLADDFLKIEYLQNDLSVKEVVLSTKNVFGDNSLDVRLSAVGNVYDSLEVDSKTDKVNFIKRTGLIENYNGESVGSVFISSTGELSAGATVIYPLGNQMVFDLSNTLFGKEILTEAVPSGSSAVIISGGVRAKDVKLKYRRKI